MNKYKRLFETILCIVTCTFLLISCENKKNPTAINNIIDTPHLSPASGIYPTRQYVKINCTTADVTIRYTIDGNEPTSNSTEYTNPICVSYNLQLKAKAFKQGWQESSTTKAHYTITRQVLKPQISPVSGTYLTVKVINIICATEGAIIHYTTDGSEPSPESDIYTDAFLISKSTTIKAIATKADCLTSDVITSTIIINFDYYGGLVYVPSGTFIMGDTHSTHSPDYLPHTVSLSPFYISKYEVTQREWIEVMGTNPSYNITGDLNLPVERVSWYSSMIYCNKRSMAQGFTPVYSINGSTNPNDWGPISIGMDDPNWNAAVCNWAANGYRMPTEAEWEYAAHGADFEPDYIYSGSNNVGDVAWYANISGNATHPVGQKIANCLGIYDMTGNVWELCWDWRSSSYFYHNQLINPTGPESGTTRIIRGGSYYDGEFRCTNNYRNSIPSYFGFGEFVGLRVVKAAL